jgi:hypothetical protein
MPNAYRENGDRDKLSSDAPGSATGLQLGSYGALFRVWRIAQRLDRHDRRSLQLIIRENRSSADLAGIKRETLSVTLQRFQ